MTDICQSGTNDDQKRKAKIKSINSSSRRTTIIIKQNKPLLLFMELR